MLITMLYIMQHISKLPHYYSVVPKEIINFATFLNQNRKNMKAFVFPGQGAQFVGMGKDLYENSALAKELFEKANDILGYRITDIMFEGTDEDLRQTKVTQPAVFLHSVISALCMGDDFKPEMTAGHSLGEFSALVAAGALSFEDGLKLVYARAMAMQKACEAQPSTMAAIIALPDEKVEEICEAISKEGEVVVAANYNCPGQIVISGSIEGINKACEQMKAAGAKRALPLKVGGAFHSPLMSPYINITSFTIIERLNTIETPWSVKRKFFYLCDHRKIFWKCFPHMPFSGCYTTFVHEASLLSLVQPEIFLNILAQIRLHFHKFPVQNILVLTFRLLLLSGGLHVLEQKLPDHPSSLRFLLYILVRHPQGIQLVHCIPSTVSKYLLHSGHIVPLRLSFHCLQIGKILYTLVFFWHPSLDK